MVIPQPSPQPDASSRGEIMILVQLGDGTTITRYTPTEITSSLNLGLGETIIGISLGNYHSSALTSTGRIFTWGHNNNGKLGDGTTIFRYTNRNHQSV